MPEAEHLKVYVAFACWHCKRVQVIQITFDTRFATCENCGQENELVTT